MKYLDFKQQLNKHPFFSLETIRLIEPTLDPIQLARWQQKGYIQPIIRGWYMFADVRLTEDLLQLMANKLISPSYISLEFALSLYNLIPEGVFQITSITSKKTLQLNSSLATFSYRHVKPLLMFGYQLRDTPFGKVCVADLEKAILDFLYLTPEANSIEFFDEMRLSKEGLQKIEKTKIEQYLRVFDQKSLRLRTERLLKYAID
jgi:predicted transcriptional regulator of viral defense system